MEAGSGKLNRSLKNMCNIHVTHRLFEFENPIAQALPSGDAALGRFICNKRFICKHACVCPSTHHHAQLRRDVPSPNGLVQVDPDGKQHKNERDVDGHLGGKIGRRGEGGGLLQE